MSRFLLLSLFVVLFSFFFSSCFLLFFVFFFSFSFGVFCSFSGNFALQTLATTTANLLGGFDKSNHTGGLSHLAIAGFDRLFSPGLPSWCNLGLWRIPPEPPGHQGLKWEKIFKTENNQTEPPDDFTMANERLALALSLACGFPSSGRAFRLFDGGCGCGDAAIFWLKKFPGAAIVGMNNDKKQIKFARSKAFHCQLDDRRVQFLLGDCAVKENFLATTPSPALVPFDFIVSLDAAYHFKTRRSFLSLSHQFLRPLGRLGLVDFCAGPRLSRWQQMALRVFASASGIPKENLCTRAEYGEILSSLGFEAIEFSSLGQSTPANFLQFLSEQAEKNHQVGRALRFPASLALVRYRIFAFLFSALANFGLFEFILVTATRRGE